MKPNKFSVNCPTLFTRFEWCVRTYGILHSNRLQCVVHVLLCCRAFSLFDSAAQYYAIARSFQIQWGRVLGVGVCRYVGICGYILFRGYFHVVVVVAAVRDDVLLLTEKFSVFSTSTKTGSSLWCAHTICSKIFYEFEVALCVCCIAARKARDKRDGGG